MTAPTDREQPFLAWPATFEARLRLFILLLVWLCVAAFNFIAMESDRLDRIEIDNNEHYRSTRATEPLGTATQDRTAVGGEIGAVVAQQEDACCAHAISSDGAATTVRTITRAPVVSMMAIAAPSSALPNSFVMAVATPAIEETLIKPVVVMPSSAPHVFDSCLPSLPLIVSGDYVQCVEGDAWTLNPENNMPPLKVRAVKEDAWTANASVAAQSTLTMNHSTSTAAAKSLTALVAPVASTKASSIAMAMAMVPFHPSVMGRSPTSPVVTTSSRRLIPFHPIANSAAYCAVLTSLPLADLRAGDLVYMSNDGTRFWITPAGDSCPPPMNIVFGVCGTFDGTPASLKDCGATVTPVRPPDMSAYVSDPQPDAGYFATLPDIVREVVMAGTNDVTCAFERTGPLAAREETVSLTVNGVEAKAFTVAVGEDWSAVTIARPKAEPFSLALKGADWSHSCGWLMLRQVGVAP